MTPPATVLTSDIIRALRKAHGVTLRYTDGLSQIIPWVRGSDSGLYEEEPPRFTTEQQRLYPVRDKPTNGLYRYLPIDTTCTISGLDETGHPWNLAHYPATTAEYTVDKPHTGDWASIVAHLKPGHRLNLGWSVVEHTPLTAIGWAHDELRLTVRPAASTPASVYLVKVYVGPADNRLVRPALHSMIAAPSTSATTHPAAQA